MLVYNLNSLRKGLISIGAKIKDLEMALELKKKKKIEYEKLIVTAQGIIELPNGNQK